MRHFHPFFHGFHGHFLAFHGGHDGGGFVFALAIVGICIIAAVVFSRK